jgi:2-polyprenyl-3-methyl-5-hydroxy-6-metoxy-1,4-benzoquinol methylase
MNDKEVNKILEDGYDKIAESYNEGRKSKKEINYKYFDALSKYFPKLGKLLDLGCGGGVPASSYFYEKGFDITGVDISSEMIKLAQQNIPNGKFFASDMLECSFPAEEFDVIISTFAIIHIPQHKQKELFEKIFNWLKKDGVAYLVLGYNNIEEDINENWRGVKMYWSHFGADEYKKILNGIGFKIIWEQVEEILNDATFYNVILRKN